MKNTQIQKLLLYFLFSMVFCFKTNAQQIIVNPMPFLEKLPMNSIFNLYQDNDGFIWIGTAYGVERYDGYDIQSFISNYKNPSKLTNNDIRCFAEDDENLWVGTVKGINLINKKTYNVSFFPDSLIQQNEIRDLFCDSKGNIWIATYGNIFRGDSKHGVLKEYKIRNNPNTFFEDQKGDLWFLTWNGDILKYDNLNDSFIQFANMGNVNPYRMMQDKQGRYWIATWGNGVWRFNPEAKEENKFVHQNIINPIRKVQEQVFYDIIQDDTYGYIWALSHFRLYVFKINQNNDLEEANVGNIKNINMPIDQYKTYSRIIKDKSGNLWLGAYDQSYTIKFEKNEIVNHTMKDIKNKLGIDANILYINKDSQGIIWCDQSRYGLVLCDEKNGRISYGNNTNSLYSRFVTSIVPSQKENAVWLSGRNDFSSKIWKMKQNNMSISVLEEYDLKKITQNPGIIIQLIEDSNGNIWIGTTSHLFFKQARSNKITVAPFKITQISNMDKDEMGNIWICSKNNLYQVNSKKGATLINRYRIKTNYSSREDIQRLSADNDNIWFSTSSGRIYLFDIRKRKVVEKTNSCDLTGDNILKIINSKNNLWVICDKYIICHDKKSEENMTYSVNDDNIFVTSFRNSAAFVDKNGCLYAGGHNGFIKIFPNRQVLKKKSIGKILITDIRANNRSVLFSPKDDEVNNSINKITLMPDARNIEIRFSTLSYTSARKIKYAYYLEGVDNEWNEIDNGRHLAFYNNIGRGEYIFHVKATDIYGNWIKEEQKITIYRLPAWYETWYAYLIYTLLCAYTVFILLRIYKKHLEKKNEIKLQDKLTSFKLNYFTNISHELLTPLTIISCAADDIEMFGKGMDKQVKILRTNTERLKRLLQQILDFRKVDSVKMQLNISKNNITSYFSDTILSNFQSLAEKKNIQLNSDIEKNVYGYVDISIIDKILFNLISNAIKYTRYEKNILVSMNTELKENRNFIVIKIKDEGIGIAKSDIELIFQKFYNNRNNTGSDSHGIGLSITKELTILHHGTINVTSELGKGSVFTVIIPIDKEEYKENELTDGNSEIIKEEEENTEVLTVLSEEQDKPSILFVDDNSELRHLVQHIFNKKYHIFTAENGIDGIDIVNNNNIDIIISDIVMPKMDGLELCRQIKSNVNTSYIPIIMLTAKNIAEDQIECYKAGAESYIPKPFKMGTLQARIDNLLKAKELLLKDFRSKMEINISNLDYKNPNEMFLKDAMECVERNIKDPNFDIVQMALDMNMSRSTLSRKFKVITGCTPLEFIRNIKLKYACNLLKEDNINISDVAYSTGFSSPKYFTKCFKEEFGMTPSEFQEQNKGDGKNSKEDNIKTEK